MTKARSKPYDPNAAMRRRLDPSDVDWFDRLAADPSIRLAADLGDNLTAIQRRSVFTLLMSRRSISQDHHNAVNRLWDDLAISRHEADRSPLVAGTGGSGTHGPLDRALAAQDRCALVASHVGSRCWLVLRDLIANEICAAPEPWRSIVRMATGEEDETCQAMAVRWACGELVRAYHDIDNDAPMPRARAKLLGGV